MSRSAWIAFAAAALTGFVTVRLSMSPATELVAELPSRADSEEPANVPNVRVRLGVRDKWQIHIDGPYRITRPGHWQILAQGNRLEKSTVTCSESGLRIADRDFSDAALELYVVRPGSLRVENTRYHGTLTLARIHPRQLLAVNSVPLDDYLASVVNGEMPANFPEAARRAQVVAARTYAVYQMKTGGAGKDYDLRADTHSQVYRGIEYTNDLGRRLAVETPDSRRIVKETRGIVATYDGRLFCTFYSAVCGGRTMRGDTVFPSAAPPLVSMPCEHCDQGPKYRWRETFQWPAVQSRLMEYLAQSGRGSDAVLGISTVDPGDGSPVEFEIDGPAGRRRISAEQLRLHVLGTARLPSSRISVELDGNLLHVRGRGWGHGVGMCQWGARGQALAGRTCEEILAYYYPGSQLVRLR